MGPSPMGPSYFFFIIIIILIVMMITIFIIIITVAFFYASAINWIKEIDKSNRMRQFPRDEPTRLRKR